jgi:hypothetical protein
VKRRAKVGNQKKRPKQTLSVSRNSARPFLPSYSLRFGFVLQSATMDGQQLYDAFLCEVRGKLRAHARVNLPGHKGLAARRALMVE